MAKRNAAGCTGGALYRPGSHRIRPIGKTSHRVSVRRHVRYLDAFVANAGISSAFVIAHDCGSALAFHLAARRPEFIRGLAFKEFISPMPTWEDFHADERETFQRFRTTEETFTPPLTPGIGEQMILEDNDEKPTRLKAIGADDVVNYRTTPAWHLAVRELTHCRGVDQIVDIGGG